MPREIIAGAAKGDYSLKNRNLSSKTGIDDIKMFYYCKNNILSCELVKSTKYKPS